MFTKLALGAAAAATVEAKAPNRAMTGTNAGGWMVLEPWITPSLFYRFLEKEKGHVGMDSYTFCEALGPVEGNKVMRAHWDAWFTEDHFKELAARELEIIRLPVGDWTLQPYGPYVGCMDGAAEKIDWFYAMADKYNIKVLMDLHAIKDSQNGYDNSGRATQITWTDNTHYRHDVHGDWWGTWHPDTQTYDPINHANFARGLGIHEGLLKRYGKQPAFYAFEPINEPQVHPVLPVLKDWYRKARKQLQEYAPQAKFVFHNAQVISINTDNTYWNDLFADDDMENVVMDVHHYQAWDQPATLKDSCDTYHTFIKANTENVKYPVWVGEWSLATDDCAHWLGGFNDGGATPKQTCNNWVDCPKSYLPAELAVDFDRTAEIVGPFGRGTDWGCIHKGKCPIDSTYFSDSDVNKIGKCVLDAYDQHVEAQFIWTAHNELEPRWDYVKAYDRGWLRRDSDIQFLQ